MTTLTATTKRFVSCLTLETALWPVKTKFASKRKLWKVDIKVFAIEISTVTEHIPNLYIVSELNTFLFYCKTILVPDRASLCRSFHRCWIERDYNRFEIIESLTVVRFVIFSIADWVYCWIFLVSNRVLIKMFSGQNELRQEARNNI